MPDLHLRTGAKYQGRDRDSFVHEVERLCEQRGLRLTPIRAETLRLVAVADHPIRAYDLLGKVHASRAAAAPTTVYRALEFLLEHGFIHKLTSINAFVRCQQLGKGAHAAHFLICNRCHCAIELEDVAISESVATRAQNLGFLPQAHTVELHGVCADCSK
jgi:Fur family zinc uptake transcriptional regulator